MTATGHTCVRTAVTAGLGVSVEVCSCHERHGVAF